MTESISNTLKAKLKREVEEFCSNNGFVIKEELTSPPEQYFVYCQKSPTTTPEVGWGLLVNASNGEYGDGVKFVAHAVQFDGFTWTNFDEVFETFESFFEWTTSEVGTEGKPKQCDGRFLEAIADAYWASKHTLGTSNHIAAAHRAANVLAAELGANVDREISGPGYTGEVCSTEKGPSVSLSLTGLSADKARAILAILKIPS